MAVYSSEPKSLGNVLAGIIQKFHETEGLSEVPESFFRLYFDPIPAVQRGAGRVAESMRGQAQNAAPGGPLFGGGLSSGDVMNMGAGAVEMAGEAAPMDFLDLGKMAAGKKIGMTLGALVQAAYHGSPHKFDKFLMKHIGTGEGAQAYGHGLYFSENPGVAKQYAEVLGQRNLGGDSPESAVLRIFEANGGDKEKTLAEIARRRELANKRETRFSTPKTEREARFDAMEAAVHTVDRPSHLYKVDIPDEATAKMLDWDKPLSEQPGGIQALARKAFKRADRPLRMDQHTGQNLYDVLASMANDMPAGKATRETVMQQAGIPGIKYLDQGSRQAGEGTRNFVVFDEDLIKILERE